MWFGLVWCGLVGWFCVVLFSFLYGSVFLLCMVGFRVVVWFVSFLIHACDVLCVCMCIYSFLCVVICLCLRVLFHLF